MSRIKKEGIGGFLNPPGHPGHSYSVVDGKSQLNINYALEQDYIDDNTKAEIRGLLFAWKKKKLPLRHIAIQDWIYRVMGYFGGCYQNPDTLSWNASDLVINHDIDPIENQDQHAGVHLIREFYPNFKLKQKHLDRAYWGSKV